MKIFKYLILSLALVFLLPLGVYAEGEEVTSQDNRVKVYFFRGEGCSHCAETEEFFNSIQEEYGSKFTIIDYETWYNTENSELMQKVAEARGEEANGVPYIIIGDKSWNGFAQDMADEIKSQIDSEYEKAVDDRYDVMTLVNGEETKKSFGGDIVALIVILLVVGGVCFGIYKARNSIN